jgi:phosphohistidine phosphatase
MSESDFTRPISQEGREIQEKMSLLLKAQGYAPKQILFSPYMRTKQTAEILAELFNISPEMEPTLGLFFDEIELIKKIPDPATNQTIFMVGHAPSLLRLANRLVGRSCPIYEIDRSGAIILQFDEKVDFGIAKFQKYLSPNDILCS